MPLREPSPSRAGLLVEFCGEWYEADASNAFTIGRHGADLPIDDSPSVPERLFEFRRESGLWWLTNLSERIEAFVTDFDCSVGALVVPRGRLPIVFEQVQVEFVAGVTTYEFAAHAQQPYYRPAFHCSPSSAIATTIPFTSSQLMLIVALAEPALRGARLGDIPTSASAAARLGWSMTAFNRKLDNVCQKLERAGVPGLHGESGRLATNRRSRLVRYALSSRLVSRDHLALLDRTG